MGNIVEYKPVVNIETFDGKVYKIPVEKFDAFKKKWKAGEIVQFGEYEFEKASNIRRTYKSTANTIDMHIMMEQDPVKKERLQDILDDRKTKHLKTNGVEHLETIYQEMYG